MAVRATGSSWGWMRIAGTLTDFTSAVVPSEARIEPRGAATGTLRTMFDWAWATA